MSERWQIDFYYEADGTAPVKEFLKDACLTIGELKQLEVRLKLLKANELRLLIERSDILKDIKTEDNLYELRLNNTPNNYDLRLDNTSNNPCIFLCALADNRLFLLHGYKKKSQITPKPEIKTAAQRRDRLLAEEESNK